MSQMNQNCEVLVFVKNGVDIQKVKNFLMRYNGDCLSSYDNGKVAGVKCIMERMFCLKGPKQELDVLVQKMKVRFGQYLVYMYR